MTIEVKAPYSYEEDVTVVVNDECNHAGKYEEELDYGYADRNICDWVDDWHNSWVCDKCEWTEFIEPEEPEYERDDWND